MQDLVRATLNYSVDNGIPPDYYFYEPEEPVKLNPPGTDPHEMEIVNGWPRAEQFDADRQGFELRPFPAAFSGTTTRQRCRRSSIRRWWTSCSATPARSGW